ncbi:hypothetical protein ebA1938 [Aromatoleum aromaticum EbN1]|uniref:Uncharacterized protein n=1 Tax=Aromatoleum aromaticum (strain DSM 19018 / LMG 30748 / EbN1) TaxID=76114 RepID=Q5P671_AROAE|nr:hypothetical protein ebA1938 [Aromatoleum aromaticum EbN1]
MNPQHLHPDVVVPGRALALQAQAGLGRVGGVGADQVEDDLLEQREVLRRVVLADHGAVLTEAHVKHPVEPVLDGLITNDKFCVTRFVRLTLTSPRHDWRRQGTAQHAACPSAESVLCGGGHETPMADSPADEAVAGRSAAVGSSLPAVAGMEPVSGGASASTGKGEG